MNRIALFPNRPQWKNYYLDISVTGNFGSSTALSDFCFWYLGWLLKPKWNLLFTLKKKSVLDKYRMFIFLKARRIWVLDPITKSYSLFSFVSNPKGHFCLLVHFFCIAKKIWWNFWFVIWESIQVFTNS